MYRYLSILIMSHLPGLIIDKTFFDMFSIMVSSSLRYGRFKLINRDILRNATDGRGVFLYSAWRREIYETKILETFQKLTLEATLKYVRFQHVHSHLSMMIFM